MFYGIDFTTGSRVLSLWLSGLAVPFAASIVFGFAMYVALPPRRCE